MKILTSMLTATLAASTFLGVWILANDTWLWEAAPAHAYGLILFVLADLVLAFAVLRRVLFSPMAAGLMATVQLGAMLADFVSGGPDGVSSTAFMRYLLNDASYVSLLLVQLAIILGALATVATPLMRHRHWAGLSRLHRHST